MPRHPPILIAACGNELAGGDAFGPRVADELRSRLPVGAELVELGMNPAALLDHLDGRRALILIDAARIPDAASGELLECDWDSAARPALASDAVLSTHALSIAGQLELARRLGTLPPVVRLYAVAVDGDGCLGSGGSATRENVSATAARVLGFARKLLIE